MTTATPDLHVDQTGDISPELDGQLSTLVRRIAGGRRIPHVTVALQDVGGQRRWSGSAGTAGPDGAPLTPDTPFAIASITKRFIATLVLQAHERGELHLDDQMTAHLPADLVAGLHVVDGVDRTDDISIRHLLSHTSGLPDHWERPRSGPSLFDRLDSGEDLTWDLADVTRWVRDDHRPHFPPQDLRAPRQRARYSDAGFQLLIGIVERATGRTYGAALQERILEPLGMERTWLPGRTGSAAPTLPPATIYSGRTPIELPGMLASSNDLVSTTGDLLRFERALLAGDLFERRSTVALLTERDNLLRNAFPLRYGLGTMRFRLSRLNAPGWRPVTLVGHSGATGTWLFTCPELGVHLAGSIDQASGKTIPFRLMARLLRVWTR